MDKEEIKIESEAILFARTHKKSIIKKATDVSIFLPDTNPVSVFMAGSPGAGKTELSKHLIEAKQVNNRKILRIDPDEFREYIPGYTGTNSYLFHSAVSIIVDAIHDAALSQKQNFIFDGTFSNLNKARENIQRSIKRARTVEIVYVYQDPLLAWSFVEQREKVEGRKIQKDKFITQYFQAHNNVNLLKKEFGNQVRVDLVIKNIDNSDLMYHANIDIIDNHLPEKYTKEVLESNLL